MHSYSIALRWNAGVFCVFTFYTFPFLSIITIIVRVLCSGCRGTVFVAWSSKQDDQNATIENDMRATEMSYDIDPSFRGHGKYKSLSKYTLFFRTLSTGRVSAGELAWCMGSRIYNYRKKIELISWLRLAALDNMNKLRKDMQVGC